MAKKPVSQPSLDDERQLLALMDAEESSVVIRGKEFPIPILTGFAQQKITRILIRKGGNEFALSCKCLAAARLKGYFKIKFLWCFLWRWYFYVLQYREDELSEAIALIKKKVPLTDWLANTTSLIGIRETTMQMNREEVFRSLQELSGDNAGKSQKTTPGSPVR